MTKSLFISIIGKTNAGKSTLLNRLCGEKIAIVTPKPQTTRTRIMGVLTKDNTQFVFVDTPGLHNAKTKLGENMMKSAGKSLDGADLVLAVADVTKHKFDFPATGETPAILVLNKVDKATPTEIAEKITAYTSEREWTAVVPISALNGSGTDKLFAEAEKFAYEAPHLFPDDALTDQPVRVMAAEIVREKLLFALREEVPHGVAVLITKMEEGEKLTTIYADIYCEREGHKKMIIGKGGVVIKQAGTLAREELERFLNTKVNLQTFVKVKDSWRENERYIKEFGLNES